MKLRTERERATAKANLLRIRNNLPPIPFKPEIAADLRAQSKQPTGNNFVKFVHGQHSTREPYNPKHATIEQPDIILRISKPKRKRNPKHR